MYSLNWTAYPNIVQSTVSEIWNDYNSKRLFIYFLINVAFMFVEFTVGILTNSLGMISDAGHMLFDSMYTNDLFFRALLFGLIASCMANWKKNDRYTYGYHRIETIIGLLNAIFLVFVAFFVGISFIYCRN